MLDIRYHTVSIIAIFLMLGTGILIGENLAPVQLKQQQKTLVWLQGQVDGAVQEGREAKQRLARLEQAIDVIRLRVVSGKLTGKHVVIIQCSDYPDAANAAEKAIRDADGTSATVIIGDLLTMVPPEDRSDLLAKLNAGANAKPVAGDPDSDPTTEALLSPLASELHAGSTSQTNAISFLEQHHYISVNGDISQPCDLFVIVGGRNENGVATTIAADTETGMIKALLDTSPDVNAIGCEPVDAYSSSIPNFQKSQIPTVDCIDLPLGQLDLPFALMGGDDSSDYGIKGTASRELPQSLEGSGSL